MRNRRVSGVQVGWVGWGDWMEQVLVAVLRRVDCTLSVMGATGLAAAMQSLSNYEGIRETFSLVPGLATRTQSGDYVILNSK